MARPLRIEYEGMLSFPKRGNARAEIFVNDDDRNLFLETCSKIDRFRWDQIRSKGVYVLAGRNGLHASPHHTIGT